MFKQSTGHLPPEDIGGWTSEAGSHKHSSTVNLNLTQHTDGASSHVGFTWNSAPNSLPFCYVGAGDIGTFMAANGNHTHSVANNGTNTGGSAPGTSAAGSNYAHNNMPPYLTVYIWKRTA